MPETATEGVLWKTVFFKISQNSQETPVNCFWNANIVKARKINCLCCREVDAMLIASAKIPEYEGSTSTSSFYGYLLDYQSHLLALYTLVVLIFGGINFHAFRGFCPKSRNFVPAKYSILLKPRKLIPAKKIENIPRISRNFPPLWQIVVRNKKCKLIL